MRTPRGAWPLIVAAVIGALLFVVPAASARPKAPGSLLPASGVKVGTMPIFTWSPVKNVDHYEFQLAADKGFNSTVTSTGGKQSTKNTAVTIPTSLASGTYWWRIRSVTAKNATSAWTKGRSVVLKWAPVMNVTGPVDGASYITPAATPADALVLRWAPMPGAAQYAVSIASDPLLATLVTSGNQPAVGDGTSFTLNGTLPDGTYYWSVTPIDAEGHKGVPSPVHSFTTHWQSSAGTPALTDLATGEELMDPVFSWSTVLGASAYELEISTSQDFAPGSRVCCDGTTTGTSYSPTGLFQDNTYYWRVRPYDASGEAGPWTVAAPFTKTFDNVTPGGLVAPAVQNIHMRDMTDVGSTSSITPVVMWDPVMGASEYQIEIDPYTAGICDASHSYGVYTTAVPAWAPRGNLGATAPLIGNAGSPRSDGSHLANGQAYCVEVRAIDTDENGTQVFGDWTTVNNYQAPAFTYDAISQPTKSPACNTSYMCAQYYVTPVNTDESQTPPVFAWKAVTGALSYYIVVSKDPSFSNILDYAFTDATAYSPRSDYPDETPGSQLYWAVLPATVINGAGYPSSANLASLGAAQAFGKQSTPPALQPANVSGAGVSFQWAPMLGASYYTLQVATDPSYSNLLENVNTDSASYTAVTSYPAGQTLYYRVRASDISGDGLAWATGTFARTLAAPVPSPASGDINPPSLDGIPTWSWSAVPGAVAYDVHTDYPNGSSDDTNGINSTTLAWAKFDGPGVWHWKVRAEFSKGANSGTIAGPWSASQTFTRTFGEPQGRRAVATKSRVILSWGAKQGAKQYHVQVASDSDFSSIVDDVTIDAVSFAPTLSSSGYTNGGRLFWHVAAVDAEGNQGDWSQTAKIALAQAMKLSADSTPTRGKTQVVTITVTNLNGAKIKGVTVRVAGAGTPPRAKRTNKKGVVKLKVHPTSAGSLIFSATKAGYQLGTIVDVISK